jgi:putative ABC transport system substrate-binding protein
MELERPLARGIRFTRRALIAGLLGHVGCSWAQRTSRAARVAYFSFRPGPNEFEQAFIRGLRELGWIDGANVVIDFRWFAFDERRRDAMVPEAMALQPDVVVIPDASGARALVTASHPSMPIVLPAMGDPVAQGYTQSLARPDHHITGISVFSTELGAKRLALLKEAMPSLRRAGALFNAARPGRTPLGVPATLAAGAELGVEVVEMPVTLPEGIDSAFAAARRQEVQAVAIISDTSTITHRAPLCDLALSHRLATIFANRSYLRAGGLMSYGPDLEGAFHRAAHYVDRVLKGARPIDLPIEQPTTLRLTLNLKTARSLGLQFPRALLLRADETIE